MTLLKMYAQSAGGCTVCGKPVPPFNMPGICVIPLSMHPECCKREDARTKRLCRRPYQLPSKRPA